MPTGERAGGGAAGDVVPDRIADRYRVLAELGRGGKARVYRVVDDGSRELALKQLQRTGVENRDQQAGELFEREFRTLVQLSHPRIIEVYDYGVTDAGPYYTMELLDGSDLRDLSPLPWRRACELVFDVCSSLALLHSRRLVHRDITPRNVRCTREGHAKLIDFGAMVHMGPCAQVVGTPAFIAPEVVHRSALDARTDLYSLGATLYYALTGRMPYPARDLAGVLKAWSSRPAAPSQRAPDVPAELDALVMSMLNLEPALRPRGAFEVMQRLLALPGLARTEPTSVSRAYLATPLMVGREAQLAAFRHMLRDALRGRGRCCLVEGDEGMGRSRLLDAFALEAEMLGAVTLRGGSSSGQGEPLAMANSLAGQLIEALPEPALWAARRMDALGSVFELQEETPTAHADEVVKPRLSLRACPDDAAARFALQNALVKWLRLVASKHALCIAIDDIDRVDEANAAMLAALAVGAADKRMLLVAACEPTVRPPGSALALFARECQTLALRPLSRDEMEALLCSLFGDVPNLALLGERIHVSAGGGPRECMALAQHLVETHAITYAAGGWTLPERFADGDLPARANDVFRARISALDARALRLARAQSLAVFDGFTRADYALLDPAAQPAEIDAAVEELLGRDVLRAEGVTYTLSHRAVRSVLRADVTTAERKSHHLALAELYERTGRPAFAAAAHWLDAGAPERALDRLREALPTFGDRVDVLERAHMPIAEVGTLFERALDAAEALPRSAREVFELRRWVLALSVACEDRMHQRVAAQLLAQLELDSGLAHYREQAGAEPAERLTRALQHAAARHAATPESERVYRVDEAIKHLVSYAVVSIVVGARMLDMRLLAPLPALLEPFAPLSPLIHAMWQNALATLEIYHRRFELARTRWLAVYEQLQGITSAQLEHADAIRNAIVYGIGTVEALLGMHSAGRWSALLDKDPQQQVNAMLLRKALCLQQGDFETAERFRRKAEVLAVLATVRQMFGSSIIAELFVHVTARDLTGVKQIMDRIPPLAEQYEGWRPYQYIAEGHFHRLRGDLAAARTAFERALALFPEPHDAVRRMVAWPSVVAGYIETLLDQGDCATARAVGEAALQSCRELDIELGASDVARVLALAEGRAGQLDRAAARMRALLDAQLALGITGLNLGTSYEALALIAIWAGDAEGVERYGRLAAKEYRHGRNSPLGMRYERLMQEARRAGIHALPELASLDADPMGTSVLGGTRATETIVTEALSGAESRPRRAAMALGLLCDAYGAGGGHLYLMDKSALVLSATVAAEDPDALEPLVTSFWHRLLEDADMATEIVTNGPTPSASSYLWTDRRGTPYEPMTIGCVVDGVTLHVGVAVLIPDAVQPRSIKAADVATTIAKYLLDCGDARGVAA